MDKELLEALNKYIAVLGDVMYSMAESHYINGSQAKQFRNLSEGDMVLRAALKKAINVPAPAPPVVTVPPA